MNNDPVRSVEDSETGEEFVSNDINEDPVRSVEDSEIGEELADNDINEDSVRSVEDSETGEEFVSNDINEDSVRVVEDSETGEEFVSNDINEDSVRVVEDSETGEEFVSNDINEDSARVVEDSETGEEFVSNDVNEAPVRSVPFSESQTKMTIYAALFVALISFGSYITLPIGPVPISMQNFFVMVAAIILGKKNGLLCISTYILAGIVGLPVFAGGFSGIGRILGSPAGGYLISYLPATYLMAIITEGKSPLIIRDLFALIVGVLTIYLGGLSFLKLYLNIEGFTKVLVIGFLPFIMFDLFKIVLAVPVIIALRKIVYPKMSKTGVFLPVKKAKI